MCATKQINKPSSHVSAGRSISYLAALGARHLSPSWCCQGCQPDSGTWLSQAAGHGWPAANRMAAPPGGSQGQRSVAGLPGSSASGWLVSGHLRPHSATGRCHRGRRRQTRWGQPPSTDLQRGKRGRGFWSQKLSIDRIHWEQIHFIDVFFYWAKQNFPDLWVVLNELNCTLLCWCYTGTTLAQREATQRETPVRGSGHAVY